MLRTRIQRAQVQAKRKEKQILELENPQNSVHGPQALRYFKQERSIIRNVKQVVRDLKKQIEEKDESIQQLRESSKYTQVLEFELKRKTYMNEVSRLQRLLSAFSDDAQLAYTISQKHMYLQEKNFQLKSALDTLRQDYEQTVASVRDAKTKLSACPLVTMADTLKQDDRPISSRARHLEALHAVAADGQFSRVA